MLLAKTVPVWLHQQQVICPINTCSLPTSANVSQVKGTNRLSPFCTVCIGKSHIYASRIVFPLNYQCNTENGSQKHLHDKPGWRKRMYRVEQLAFSESKTVHVSWAKLRLKFPEAAARRFLKQMHKHQYESCRIFEISDRISDGNPRCKGRANRQGGGMTQLKISNMLQSWWAEKCYRDRKRTEKPAT